MSAPATAQFPHRSAACRRSLHHTPPSIWAVLRNQRPCPVRRPWHWCQSRANTWVVQSAAPNRPHSARRQTGPMTPSTMIKSGIRAADANRHGSRSSPVIHPQVHLMHRPTAGRVPMRIQENWPALEHRDPTPLTVCRRAKAARPWSCPAPAGRRRMAGTDGNSTWRCLENASLELDTSGKSPTSFRVNGSRHACSATSVRGCVILFIGQVGDALTKPVLHFLN
jgi:hypothetical protein